MADCGGLGSVAPARGMWEGFVWVRRIPCVSSRVRHHGLLRLARIRWLSAACVGQFNAVRTGVADPHALVECVSRSRVVGLYEGVPLGKVVGVDGWFRSRCLGVYRLGPRRDEVISWLSCRLLTCGWPVRDSHCVCAVVRHLCTAGGRLRWAGHVCAASVAPRVPECVFLVSARGASEPKGGFPRAARGGCGGQ